MTAAEHPPIQICYLLAFPYPHAQAAREPEPLPGLKDAPYFQPIDLEIRTIQRSTLDIEDMPVVTTHQIYDNEVQIVECRYPLPGTLSTSTHRLRALMKAAIRNQALPVALRNSDDYEEYTIYLIGGLDQPPDDFIDQHKQTLALLMRSQREVLSSHEVDDILASRARYSERDLTLVDWEGAIIIAANGDFQSDIELMKIGNYQLMRYRMLDEEVERNLRAIRENLQEGSRPSLLPNRARRALREIVQKRLSLMLDFEKTDQNLLLIGDWYSAKLYHIIYEEFYLDEWKSIVKTKLENLESIMQVVQDNFTVSWASFVDLLQALGWLILLVGYFILFFLDSSIAR
jgi:hypothetical protein